eukprot:CAMPEP_0183722650 /NCGR_PEP_ID=MMETSP0737-20130205/14543_1 /TAXON_ID=385413 /ORGANISM="Thalassiosira miniscula, Strain CCMP1093" /LENGTH=169 /DNA_ID=CAMNT_0025952857 /DNA_START=106 /DNA_END=611 /DNA_ORIENTATION=+
MGVPRQANNSSYNRNISSDDIYAKTNKKGSTKLSFLKRAMMRRARDTHCSNPYTYDLIIDEEVGKDNDDDLGDIPCYISAPLPQLSLSMPSLDSLDFPCNAVTGENRDPHESMEKKLVQQSSRDTMNHEQATNAKFEDIFQQPPSLDQLPRYVAALSPAVSPDPTAWLP